MSWPSATHTQYTQAHVPNHYQGKIQENLYRHGPLYYQRVHMNRAAAQPNNQHFLAWRPQHKFLWRTK